MSKKLPFCSLQLRTDGDRALAKKKFFDTPRVMVSHEGWQGIFLENPHIFHRFFRYIGTSSKVLSLSPPFLLKGSELSIERRELM